MKSLFTALMLLACATPAAADPLSISGPVRVVDGDTVVVSGIHVRLKGVDLLRLMLVKSPGRS
jgi:endonuclease YncB( thermonuclease family)